MTDPTSSTSSPLLTLPGAVSGDGIDAPVAAHYGSFNREQRTLVAGDGFVDLSHRGVIRVSGPDRLSWLHSLTTQHLESLVAGVPTAALILSPNGHVEHAMYGTDDGETFTAHVEPGQAAPLVAWLNRMRFMMRVEVEDLTATMAVAWRPVPAEPIVRWSSPAVRWSSPVGRWSSPVETPASTTSSTARSCTRTRRRRAPTCGMWAYEALRIARGEPRLGRGHRPADPRPARWAGSGPGRAPRQGLLPRAGDGRARAHPRAPAAAPRRCCTWTARPTGCPYEGRRCFWLTRKSAS